MVLQPQTTPGTRDVETKITQTDSHTLPTITSNGDDGLPMSPHEWEHLIHSPLPVEAELLCFQVCPFPPTGVREEGEGGALPVGG